MNKDKHAPLSIQLRHELSKIQISILKIFNQNMIYLTLISRQLQGYPFEKQGVDLLKICHNVRHFPNDAVGLAHDIELS